MGLFSSSPKAGGIMDVIRCDEPEYLIWKWHPAGSQQGNNNRENAIRWGSSLRVKDGEVAIFVYSQSNGVKQEFIHGPYDDVIKTDNFPVLASIYGLAYQGNSPFQAEIYFINLAKIIQIPFGVPFFDLFDPRYPEFAVPTAVRGTITFNITDYKGFIKLHRLINFDLRTFQTQIRDAMTRYVKGIVINVPEEKSIPVVQIERQTSLINDLVEAHVRERLGKDFGVNVVAVDINAIEIDKTSEGYKQLKSVTQDIVTATVQAQAEANIKNIHDMQRINAHNLEENLRIQREEAQYAQHKQTQSANLQAFQMEEQAAVGIAGANALGQMGLNGATEMTGSGAMNPAAMMTGMAMGGVIGQNMAGMMNGMITGLNSPQQETNQMLQGGIGAPPPIVLFNVVIDGQATGPFNKSMLSQMISEGKMTKDSFVWKQGMPDWMKAEDVQELTPLFTGNDSSNQLVNSGMPPIPPV